MKTERKRYRGEFKAKIAVEAIKGQPTVNEIARAYSIHPNLVTQWKKQALAELPRAFSARRFRAERAEQELKEQLYQQIGRLKVELEWVKKESGLEY